MLLLELSVDGMKWLAAAIIFLASFGGGLLPYLLKRRSQMRAAEKERRIKDNKERSSNNRKATLTDKHDGDGASSYQPPVHSVVVQAGSLQSGPAAAAGADDDDVDALGMASPLAPAPSDAPADALRVSESFRARHPDAKKPPRRRGSAAAAHAPQLNGHGKALELSSTHGHGHSHSKSKRKHCCHMNVDRFLSLGNMMGAGIFLGGGLLHLLPEAAEELHEVQHKWTDGPLHEYPLAFLLCALGFFVILIVEEVVIAITTKNKQKKEKKILAEKEKIREEKEAAAAKKRAEAKQARLAAAAASSSSTPARIPKPVPLDLGTPRGSFSGVDSECGTPLFDRSSSPFGDPLKRDLEHNLVQGLTTRIMLLPAMPFRKPRRRRTQRRARAAEAEMGTSVSAVGDHSLSVQSSQAATAPMAIRSSRGQQSEEEEESCDSDESAGPIQQFLDAAYNSPSPFPSLTAADPLITRRLQSRMRHAHRSRRGSYPADDSDSNMMYAAAASAAAAARGGADSPVSDLGSPLVTPNAAGSAFDYTNAGTPTSGTYLASSRALAAGNGALGREADVRSAPPVAAPAPPAAAFAVAKPSTPASVVALRQPLLVKPETLASDAEAEHSHPEHDHDHEKEKDASHDGHGHVAHGHGHGGDSHGHSHMDISQGTSYIVAYLLVLALSFHNIFEGIALGTQQDYPSTVSIFIAILAHSPLAGFALGVSLVKARATPLMLLSCLFIFSFMTMAGAALGLGLSYALEGDTLTVVSACFQSFSAGTFLFVALEEIIPKEMAMPKDKALKLFLCLLGLLFMAAVKLFEGDEDH